MIMKSKTPIHLLKGIRYLDNINIEERLLEPNPSRIFDNEYFIDLSQVGHAEFGALAKLILIIESYLKSNSIIFIALPTITFTKKEKVRKLDENYTQSTKENLLKSRIKANSFIKTSGFVAAVQQIAEIYNKQVYLTESYEFESEFNQESFSNSFSVIYERHNIEEYDYRYIYPFHWIDCSHGPDNFLLIEKDLNKILENPEKGLDPIDVKAIKNVIFSELIKNVKEHSGSKYALLGIGLINTISLTLETKYRKINPIEKPYFNWVKENMIASQVEIYFGDSGIGIFSDAYVNKYKKDKNGNNLNKDRQLELAFERWTTSKNDEPRRGTKGLYRIQRIINKYNGIVHIETDFFNGGFRKGGLNESRFFCRNTGKYFQGTLVSIKLNPFKEVKSFKYVIESKTIEKNWNSARFIIDKELKCLEAIKNKIKESSNLLLVLNIDHFDDITANGILENLLPEISYDSHPCAVVIYLISNLPNDSIDTITDSANYVTIKKITEKVNQQIIDNAQSDIFLETRHESEEDIYDPVLVIGEKNQAFWYGGNQELLEVLSESFKIQSGKSIKLEELKSFKSIAEQRKLQIRFYLQNDNKLVNIDNDNNIIFNFQSIDHLYKSKLYNKLTVVEDKTYCTPKLHLTNRWVNISELLKEDEFGYALCLYLKYQETINILDLDKDNVFILTDHPQQKDLVKAFASLLGISRKNIRNIYSDIDINLPKRTKLFPENSNVIILTTIISSSETVRRLVKFIKRDYANADCILCLANLRRSNITKLRTWNKTTNIISCFQQYEIESENVIKNFQYFANKYSLLNNQLIKINPSFEVETKVKLVSVDSSLKELISTNKILHYNHVGIFNKRHFTFFIDKQRLLDIDSVIWENIKISIDEWKSNYKINNYRILIPKSILNTKGKFVSYLSKLANSKPFIIDEVPSSINEPNILYFDFGMLTGDSVNKIITSCQQVNNLFICILFNQSINSKTDFYKRIDTLNNLPDIKGEIISTSFQIKYLYDLPLSFFSSDYCPICEHIRSLNYYKLDQDYLFKFSEDRQKKLKQINNDEIKELSYPVDFYYSEKEVQHELSSTIIMMMYEFKILFENSKESTTARIKVYNEIFDLYVNNDSLIQDCDSKLYAFLYYLSHEIHWFQHEPLVFRDIRIMVSDLALKVATIERSKLIEFFIFSNKSDTSTDMLAVRYKYAAISVLRSTDKLNFCKNIALIIKSSLLQNKYSDNLLQNTLYHIVSLQHNKYNQSEIYFHYIKINLQEIISINQHLRIEQKLAINKILLKNSLITKALDERDIENESKMFKMMKSKWETLYSNTPQHPEPFIYFDALYLEKHKNTIYEFSYNNASEADAIIIREIINDLEENWRAVRDYLNNEIYYYFEDKLNLLYNSNFFYYYYENHLNTKVFKKNLEKFSELLYLIQENPKNYLTIQEDYNKLYTYFENSFIKKKGLQNQSEDSLILNLLSEFPTSLIEMIDEVFPISIFSHRKVENKTINNLVYFPKKVFKRNLLLVRKNIENRLNNDCDLKNVNIIFFITELNEVTLQLDIIYDSTNNYKENPKRKGGSLDQWNQELHQFEGDLDYDLPNESNSNFSLHLKLKKYE